MVIEKVLLVDDQEDMRVLAELSLRDIGGFQTILASSGREGIERAQADQPDLIVLDIMMPEMDGLETLRRLREDPVTRRIPVILMTARGKSHEVKVYLAAGAIGVINKPFDPMALPQQVKDIATSLEIGQ